MRVKTEERRQAIIEKAREVFQEEGFDRASMSEIAARVGGSKATLYSYFKSKEELFVAVMKGSTEVGNVYKPFADPSLPKVSSFEDLREILQAYGLHYVRLQTSENALAVRRSLIAQGDRSDMGKVAFEGGPLQNYMMVATFLERMMREGYLRQEVPWVALGHLIHLLESGLILPRLIGVIKSITPEMINDAVPRAIDVFLRGYGMPDHVCPEKAKREAA
jgi:AcrR family transcriptional regulator